MGGLKPRLPRGAVVSLIGFAHKQASKHDRPRCGGMHPPSTCRVPGQRVVREHAARARSRARHGAALVN